MTYYYYISSNINIENDYLNKYRIQTNETFIGSKCLIQYELYYNVSQNELEKVYEILYDYISNDMDVNYIVLEIAHALSAEGIPYKVKKKYDININEFKKEHLFNLKEDEMIRIERKRGFEKN